MRDIILRLVRLCLGENKPVAGRPLKNQLAQTVTPYSSLSAKMSVLTLYIFNIFTFNYNESINNILKTFVL